MSSNIYCTIMAGGQGSRLWPVSQPAAPKQFIDLVGVGRTMLQLTYDRFRTICEPDHFVVVTNEEYAHLVRTQLPDIPEQNILCEPFRRNTASCIAYANTFIKQHNPDAVTVVTPSDHLILDNNVFVNSVSNAIKFASNNDALVTIGVKAYKPETSFGYIQFGEIVDPEVPSLFKVKTFTEKPNLEMAQIFYECGEFCWNSGVFVWNVKAIEMALSKYLPSVQSQFDHLDSMPFTYWTKEAVRQVYDECDNISIDYAVLERASNVYIEQTDASWSDLGGWEAIYEQTTKDSKANATTGGRTIYKDSAGCLVSIPESKVCIVEGLKDYMVVENNGILLICHRSNGRLVSTYAADIDAAIEK